MIATASMQHEAFGVAQKPRLSVLDSELLRVEAAAILDTALDGVSGKKIQRAGVMGAGVTFLSRARHGDAGNPLFRLVALFRLGRILGVPKERFQRLIDWAQTQLDRAYADAPAPSVAEVLDRDAELDPKDDYLRYRAACGDVEARRALVVEKQQQVAHARTVILALSQG